MSGNVVSCSGGRFQIQRTLGRGGMATVYEAIDAATGRRVALKRLLPGPTDERRRHELVQLFEREFHVLSQLAHPRVVEVYDYGLDDEGPYYTMELLDGGDLLQPAPLPWLGVCAIARDVCSALSLLHSRRMVYRDLSPRNVRCTNDGMAKLIDFDAMTIMGISRNFVGTVRYCAPEAVHLQPLDARTDLFALGATLYRALTGRDLYPARDFSDLREVWRRPRIPPSRLVPGIPAALDALVLDLAEFEPAARPASAAEVMQRLGAVDHRLADEHLLVSQSYLCTPNLVGRERQLNRARFRLMRGLRGRGGTLVIRGEGGRGRSRLLAACILEAKLLGALVVRADAADGQGEFGVVAAIAAQLADAAPAALASLPEATRAVLGCILAARHDAAAAAPHPLANTRARARRNARLVVRGQRPELARHRRGRRSPYRRAVRNSASSRVAAADNSAPDARCLRARQRRRFIVVGRARLALEVRDPPAPPAALRRRDGITLAVGVR